jgi:hypothetical protein
VADRRDEGSGCRGSGTHDALVAETQQVLEVAATPGDDDDLDRRIGVESLDGGNHFGRGAIALHRGVHDAELDRGPAEPGVADHVVLGVAVFARDEPDDPGQERQRALATGIEEPLGGELRPQSLESLEQVAESDMLQLEHLHGERPALDPPVRLHQRDHVVAGLELLVEASAHRRPHLEREGCVGIEVFELAVDVAPRDAPLGDLALDPDRAEAVEVLLELAGEECDGPRRIACRRCIRHEASQAARPGGAA